jgi:hypothetical protein
MLSVFQQVALEDRSRVFLQALEKSAMLFSRDEAPLWNNPNRSSWLMASTKTP